jgi:polyhydroxybutyrate depolymerase
VSVLEVHGTADDTVDPAGGKTEGRRYPSVRQTVGEWRELDQCDDRPGSRKAGLDAAADLPGAETVRISWSRGCAENSEVALWTVRGGAHVPDFTRAFTTALLDWLMAQARSGG